MTDAIDDSRRAFIAETLSGPRPVAADELAAAIIEKHPGVCGDALWFWHQCSGRRRCG